MYVVTCVNCDKVVKGDLLPINAIGPCVGKPTQWIYYCQQCLLSGESTDCGALYAWGQRLPNKNRGKDKPLENAA